jgi:hypothetical protein
MALRIHFLPPYSGMLLAICMASVYSVTTLRCIEMWWLAQNTRHKAALPPVTYLPNMSLLHICHVMGTVYLYMYWSIVRFPPTVTKCDKSWNLPCSHDSFILDMQTRYLCVETVSFGTSSGSNTITVTRQAFGKCICARMFAEWSSRVNSTIIHCAACTVHSC